MGHLQRSKSSLVPLIDRLNRYRIGLVENAKLREILALLFDKREVLVASRFPLMEATLDELCEATAMPASERDGIHGVHGQQGAGHGHALRRAELLPSDARADRVHGVHLHVSAVGFTR